MLKKSAVKIQENYMRTIQYIGVGIVAVALTAETLARMLKEMREWKPRS